MRPVYVDTGAWVGVSSRADQFHSVARKYAEELSEGRVPLLTTNYVLAESYTRIRYDHGHRTAMRFDAAIGDLSRSRRLVVAWVTPTVHERALQVFRKYSDQDFSLVDCASFIAARDHRVREVFGFDRGFLVMGFQLRPELPLR